MAPGTLRRFEVIAKDIVIVIDRASPAGDLVGHVPLQHVKGILQYRPNDDTRWRIMMGGGIEFLVNKADFTKVMKALGALGTGVS